MTKKIFGGAALLGMLLTAGGAFADTNVSVTNISSATVGNTAVVTANTGYNVAEGGESGAGGAGGAALGGFFGMNLGGDGGDSGMGGSGGVIVTGDALASSLIVNDVNSSDTTVEILDCGCEPAYNETLETWYAQGWHKESDGTWHWYGYDYGYGDDHESEGTYEEDWSLWTKTYVPVDTNVSVTNITSANVGNTAVVDANTGNNVADGDDSGAGGNGGNAESTGGFPFPLLYELWEGGYGYDYGYFGGNIAGNGGMSGDGGVGGTIATGDSVSVSEIANVVNESMTRILKD